jgi:peptidoglycan LD-endopeptidase CwlK
MFVLTPLELKKLDKVDPKLKHLFIEAAKTATVPFRILEGRRTAAQQMIYFKQGTSMLDGVTKISNHQKGRAVDCVPLVNGKVITRSWTHFYPLSNHIKATAKALGISITWGGDWTSFKDGPHYELN